MFVFHDKKGSVKVNGKFQHVFFLSVQMRKLMSCTGVQPPKFSCAIICSLCFHIQDNSSAVRKMRTTASNQFSHVAGMHPQYKLNVTGQNRKFPILKLARDSLTDAKLPVLSDGISARHKEHWPFPYLPLFWSHEDYRY